MVRTAREHRKSWYSLIIWAALMGLLYLIFGPNTFQNPFMIILAIVSMCFITSWIFGYIHPTQWGKTRKQRKKHSFIKEAPGISEQVPVQEEPTNVNKISCPHCGILQDQGTKFCTKCGQKIE